MAIKLDTSGIPVNSGGTGFVDFTSNSIICAGTTSTNPLQFISNFGSSGQVLVTNGSSTHPSFQNGPVRIIQAVSNSTTQAVTVTSTTYTDSTLSATITPTTSSNKILVIISQQIDVTLASGTTVFGGLRVLRDSTVIHQPATGPSDFGGTASAAASFETLLLTPIFILDSPNTTSAVTYKTQGALDRTGTFYLQEEGGAAPGTGRIILMEIAA